MDFRGMKRKDLQALCKQHGFPANLTNLEMADRLSLLYKEKEKPVPEGRSCLKNLDEIGCLNDFDAVTCKPKRVRFSPENETFEFERSEVDRKNTRAARAARRSMVRLAKVKVSAVSENTGNSESCEETKDSPNRITRYQTQKFIEGHVVKASPLLSREKKAKKGTKVRSSVSEDVEESAKLAPMSEVDDNACGKENGRPIRRHLRSREVVIENASELANEDAIIPRKNSVQTRSKKMNLKDSNEVLTTNEISKDTISPGEGQIFANGKVFKQSKRKASGDGKCELLDGELEKRKVVGRITRSRAQLVAEEASAVEGEKETEDESELQVSKDSEAVLQLEEPSKLIGRNTLRQKSVVSQSDPSVRNKSRKQGKDTRLEGETSGTEGGSKEKEKASLPYGPLRRSRRNASVVKSTVSPDGELATQEAVGRNHPLKHLGEPVMQKAGSQPEASIDLKESEKVSQHNGPVRRSRRNTSTCKSIAPAADENLMVENIVGRKEHSKYLRESTLEKESSATEAHLRRSKRNASRHDSISASTLTESIPNATEKNEAQKRRLQLILEEETSAVEDPLIDELPRQSKRNASTCNIVGPAKVDGVMGKKKQRGRSKFPSSKGEAQLTDSMLDTEKTPSIDIQLSEPVAAGSKSPVLIHQRGTPEDTSKKRKSSRKTSSAKKKQHESVEICPVISDLEEVEDCTTVNFEDIPVQSAAAVEEDVVEDLTTVNLEDILSQSAVAIEEDISMENVKENLVQDNVNEANKVDEESQFQIMRRDLDYDNLIEPQGDQLSSTVSSGLVSPVYGLSSIHQPDYAGSSVNYVKFRKELETEEELSAGKHIDPTSNILEDLVAENDKSSVETKWKLGPEEMYGCAEPVMHELGENLKEFNGSCGSKRNFITFSEESSGIPLLNPSSGEQATPNISGRRDVDDAKDPEAGAEFPDNVVASQVETAEIVAEKIAIQLASSGPWSTEETPLKILLTPECLTSNVMGDKLVGSYLHTVSADNGSQEEGYQLDAQLAAQSPVLGRSNPNQAEGEKAYFCETELIDRTMCDGKLSVSDARERNERPVMDELDGQISGKKESVMSKGATSFSEEVKETASAIVEKRTPSCEHPHLKDKGEGNQDPMEKDEEYTHAVTETASTTISEGKTSSDNMGSVKLHHEKSQEDEGAGKRDCEGISNMRNPSLEVDEAIYNEASKGNLDMEFTGLDGCACPLSNKFSKDDHATADTVSGGSHLYSGIASRKGKGTNVDEPSAEEITPAILEERDIAETRDFEEGDKIQECSVESQLTPGSTAGHMEKETHFAEITQCSDGVGLYPPSHVNALKHQASGNEHKKMSSSTRSLHIPKQEGNQLETVSVNEVLSQQTCEDLGSVKCFTQEALPMSSPSWFLEKLYDHEEEGIDGKGIEDHDCVSHGNSIVKTGSREVLPEIEIGSVLNYEHMFVEQVNNNVDSSSVESGCKDNKRSSEAIAGYSSVMHVSPVAGESELLPGIELGDSQEVNAKENINFDATLDEITCQESETLEKTTSEIKKSALEGIEEFNTLKGESGKISAPVSQTELNTQVLDQGVELIKTNASSQVALIETIHEDSEVPKGILDEVTMEANFDCNETKDVAMEVENDISLQHDELKSIDPDIHDAKDKSIFTNLDQSISADRDTIDEIEHSRILEGNFNFEGDCSNLKCTDVSASPLISLKDFVDRVEDEEVAHMHDSQTAHEADENLDTKADRVVEMIWKEVEVKFGEIDDCKEEVLTEANRSSFPVPHETSTGANGTMKENNHFEDVSFDPVKQEDVTNSPKVTDEDCDDLLEEKSVDVKHNDQHVLLDLNCGGEAEQVEDRMVCEMGSDHRNGGIMWARVSQTSPYKIDDSNISPSEAEKDSINARVSLSSVSWQEERGTGAENSAGKAEEAEMNCLSVVSPVNLPIDQAALDHRTLVYDTASNEFHSGRTNSVFRDAKDDEDQSSTFRISETNSTFEDSKDTIEVNESIICTEQIAQEIGKDDHLMAEVEVAVLNCNQLAVPTEPVFEDSSTLRDSKMAATTTMKEEVDSENDVNEIAVSSTPVFEDGSTLRDPKMAAATSMKEEVDYENDVNELAVSTAPVFEDGSTSRDPKMAAATTMKEDVDCDNDAKKLAVSSEPAFEDGSTSREQSMSTTMKEKEVCYENDINELAVPTEPVSEDGSTSRDQKMATSMKEEVDCENDVNEIDRNDTNDSGNDTSDEHTAEVASGNHLTRLEDTTDDSSLIHQIGVNSGLPSSETASCEFSDWEIDLFSHDNFCSEDKRVATGSGRHGETGGAVEKKEAVSSGPSSRTISQSHAIADSAPSKAFTAEDVCTEKLKLETVGKKSWDTEEEEINHLSSSQQQQFNSSKKMRKERTPNEFFNATFDMKENNTPSIKMEQTGTFTAMKSGIRRKALEDIRERNSSAR